MQNALKVSFGVTKRAFTIAVVVATLAWSVAATFAVAPRVASAATPVAGSLVKGSMSAVYYIGSDNKRYVFTNDKAYMTWYADFSTVQTISDTDLAAITIGGNVTYKPGVKMVKIQSDPKVYAVAHGGVLRWVATEAAATALYGSNWNTKIDDISDAFFTNYTVGTQINSASDYTIANEQTNSPTINADKGLSGGGALNITLASDNPAGMTLTRNAQGVNLLKLNVSGTGTITGLTFTRQGAGTSTDWDNVYLYSGDTRLTTGRSVNSTTNQVAFSSLSVAVSGTTELTLVGDQDAASTIGDSNAFSLVAATDVVASTTVGGTFPVTGNNFTISGSTGGSIRVDAGSTPSNPSMGQTGATLAEFKLTAGPAEDLSIRRIVITNAGAGQLANLANLSIQTNGTAVAQSPIISGDTATFVFAVPYVLGKGITRVFDVVGDLAAGNRAGVDTFKLYVDQTYDIYATGNTYGAGVGVTDNFTSNLATLLTVTGGQITFVSNGPTTGNIPVGANDAVIQKFAITSVNNIEVDDLRMQITSSANLGVLPVTGNNAIPNITDCKVKNSDTGATVTNSYDLSGWTPNVGNTIFTKTFTDRFDINAGTTMNLALTCDIASTPVAGLAGVALTGTVGARLDGDIRNLDSNMLVTVSGNVVPASALNGNAQTISASGLTVALASSPSSSTVTKGSTVNALGVNFTAGSASDVKVSQLKLQGFISLDGTNNFGTTSSSVAPVASHLVQDVVQSVTIWDGTTQVGVAESPDASGGINFTNLAWNISAGTTKTLTVQVVLSNNLPYGTSANRFFIDMIGTGTDGNTSNLTAQDNNSNTITASSTAWLTRANLQQVAAGSASTPTSNGSTIIVTGVSSGTLQVQIDGNTPVAGLVTANTSDNATTRIEFTSINEAFNVTRLTVENTATAASRSITSVRLFDPNGTLFCSGSLDSNSRLRCANDAGLFTVNGNATITVKMNIDQEGSGTTGANSGDAPILALYVNKTDTTYLDDIKAVGVSSGASLQDAQALDQGDVGFATAALKIFADSHQVAIDLISGNQQVIRKTQPTVATIAVSTTLTSNPTVYKFAVTAASNADVAIKRFNLAESNVGVDTIAYQLYENDVLLDSSLYSIGTGSSFAAGTPTIGTNLSSTGGGHIVANASGTVSVYFVGQRVISAGTTKTYRLDCSVSSGAIAGHSITFKLLDDSTQTVQTGDLTAENITANNFVWSDSSADAHSAGDVNGVGSSADWTNGKYVQVLPTTAQTLSL